MGLTVAVPCYEISRSNLRNVNHGPLKLQMRMQLPRQLLSRPRRRTLQLTIHLPHQLPISLLQIPLPQLLILCFKKWSEEHIRHG
jgi:hypothetical protein